MIAMQKSELVTIYRLTHWYMLKHQYTDEMCMTFFFSKLAENQKAVEKAIILHLIICHKNTKFGLFLFRVGDILKRWYFFLSDKIGK